MKVDNILRDQKKITKVDLKDSTSLNFVVNQEKYADTDLKKCFETNSMAQKNKELLKPLKKASFHFFPCINYKRT